MTQHEQSPMGELGGKIVEIGSEALNNEGLPEGYKYIAPIASQRDRSIYGVAEHNGVNGDILHAIVDTRGIDNAELYCL